MQEIKSIEGIKASELSKAHFDPDVPTVFKGFCSEWKLTKHAKNSNNALIAYIKTFSNNTYVGVNVGEPSIKGNFGYNENMEALNFQRFEAPMNEVLDQIANTAGNTNAPSIYIGSALVSDCLPDLEDTRKVNMPGKLNAPDCLTKIWIANRSRAACHQDMNENLACCVAGRKRFVLFPPDQIKNLYPGPLEFTPAGPSISLVDINNPDLTKFPRYEEALKQAQVAELEPGDAIYIPYLWWHDVTNTADLNVQINYWWNQEGTNTIAEKLALYHSIVELKHLPPARKNALKAQLEYYAYDDSTISSEHIPATLAGVSNKLSIEQKDEYRKLLADQLMKLTERKS